MLCFLVSITTTNKGDMGVTCRAHAWPAGRPHGRGAAGAGP